MVLLDTLSSNPKQQLDLMTDEKTLEIWSQYHNNKLLPNQCGSCLTQTIDAPLKQVWSVISRFDEPQTYKKFIKSCRISEGDGGIGSIREVSVVTGIPARSSIERLDMIDDKSHVMSFSVVGGDHRLVNYKSTITLHHHQKKKEENNKDDYYQDDDDDDDDEGKSTVVIESYVVDVPSGNTEEETRLFTNTIVRSNLRNLASFTENRASSSSSSYSSSFASSSSSCSSC